MDKSVVSRRTFIRQATLATFTIGAGLPIVERSIQNQMTTIQKFDAIIVGGSYSGLAAAMALGRALKRVLVIDSGKPCNAQTPHSHNFLTRDGMPPAEIAAIAKAQVQCYEHVQFVYGLASAGKKTGDGFEISLDDGRQFGAAKLIFATGIKDMFPDIDGFAHCWGISAIHCPYCHGYEVRHQKTGILGNGEAVYEYVALISNWTADLKIFTNGKSEFTTGQTEKLRARGIDIIEKQIARLEQRNGQIGSIRFTDGSTAALSVLYAPRPFEQHSKIPETLGCEMTDEGFIKTDALQQTSVPGIFACGDNASRMRTVANAVSTGTTAGIAASKAIVLEAFESTV